MQSDNGSPSPSRELELSPPTVPAMVEAFAITQKDARILEEYLEEFQEGDVDLRSRIIANVMVELCGL